MRKLAFLPLLLAAALVTSCATFLAVYEFEGAAVIDGTSVGLLFRFTTYEQLVRGSYYVDGAEEPTGLAEGTISGAVLVMTLTEGECVFDFEGTVNTSTLAGTVTPRTDGCGSGGSWTLQHTGDGF